MSTTTTPTTYEIKLSIPKWVVSLARTLALWGAIFAAGVAAGGGKLHLPVIHWPSPTPAKPAIPDWIPPNPPPAPTPTPVNVPDPVPADEWRPLAWAPGWEGYGHEINGVFMVSNWRLMAQPVQQQPVQVQPLIYRGRY